TLREKHQPCLKYALFIAHAFSILKSIETVNILFIKLPIRVGCFVTNPQRLETKLRVALFGLQ
ncbi:MAG TPA: hypothetical protein PLU23_02835, partial [Anaerolineaceae bacterium]|nr:hypothetical protein [Anaerolineaceae bacterium]